MIPSNPDRAKISLSLLAAALHLHGRRVGGNRPLFSPQEPTNRNRTAHVNAFWYYLLALVHGLSRLGGGDVLPDRRAVQPEIGDGPVRVEDRDCALSLLLTALINTSRSSQLSRRPSSRRAYYYCPQMQPRAKPGDPYHSLLLQNVTYVEYDSMYVSSEVVYATPW